MEKEGKGSKLRYAITVSGLGARTISSASCRFYTKNIKQEIGTHVDATPTIDDDVLDVTVDTSTLNPGNLYADLTIMTSDSLKQVIVLDLDLLLQPVCPAS